MNLSSNSFPELFLPTSSQAYLRPVWDSCWLFPKSCPCFTFLKLHSGQRTWAATKRSGFGQNPENYFEPRLLFVVPFPRPGCCSVCHRGGSAAFPNCKWPPPPPPLLCQVGGSTRSQPRSPSSELCISTPLLVSTLSSSLPKRCCKFSAHWTFSTGHDRRVEISKIGNCSWFCRWLVRRERFSALRQKVCSFWALDFYLLFGLLVAQYNMR